MAFNEVLADRIRMALADIAHVEEKQMFGGICFMVNDKMCMGVSHDEVMCRIGPENYLPALEKPGCRKMTIGAKSMNGYVLLKEEAIHTKKEFKYWINLCLKFNVQAKASKKKK